MADGDFNDIAVVLPGSDGKVLAAGAPQAMGARHKEASYVREPAARYEALAGKPSQCDEGGGLDGPRSVEAALAECEASRRSTDTVDGRRCVAEQKDDGTLALKVCDLKSDSVADPSAAFYAAKTDAPKIAYELAPNGSNLATTLSPMYQTGSVCAVSVAARLAQADFGRVGDLTTAIRPPPPPSPPPPTPYSAWYAGVADKQNLPASCAAVVRDFHCHEPSVKVLCPAACSSYESYGRRLGVYGTDSRDLVDAEILDDTPYRQVVRIVYPHIDHAYGICTGTWISEEHVMTCGHCLYKPPYRGFKDVIGVLSAETAQEYPFYPYVTSWK